MAGLEGLLDPSAVLPWVKVQSKKQALSELAETLATARGLDGRAVFEAVIERERLGSTGVGEGVGIPHARIEGLDGPVGGFARLETAVDFDAIDEQPCDLVFMLIAPKDAGADHLRALARISRVFRQASVRDALRAARTKEAIAEILSDGQKTDAA